MGVVSLVHSLILLSGAIISVMLIMALTMRTIQVMVVHVEPNCDKYTNGQPTFPTKCIDKQTFRLHNFQQTIMTFKAIIWDFLIKYGMQIFSTLVGLNQL